MSRNSDLNSREINLIKSSLNYSICNIKNVMNEDKFVVD